MKRRLLAGLISVVMILSLLPISVLAIETGTIPAPDRESTQWEELTLAEKDVAVQWEEITPIVEDSPEDIAPITATSWDDLKEKIESTQEDITVTISGKLKSTYDRKTITIPTGVSITLLGDNATISREQYPHTGDFIVPSGASLILQGDITISGGNLALANYIEVQEGGELCIEGSLTANNSCPDEYGNSKKGLILCNGTMKMIGSASISGWKNTEGDAAIRIDGENARFVMEGGVISGCYVANKGSSTIELMNGASMVMNDGVIQNNGIMDLDNPDIYGSKGNNGGAIYVGDGSSCQLNTGTLKNNKGLQGGAIYAAPGATLTIKEGVSLIKNTSSYGGAIYGGSIFDSVDGATINIDNATIIENTAIQGSAISVRRGSLTMTGGTVSRNVVETDLAQGNGAIYVEETKLYLVGTEITKNTTVGGGDNENYGGGLYLHRTEGSLENVKISENVATAGAGIFSDESDLKFISCEISNNKDGWGNNPFAHGGAGIYAEGSDLCISGTEEVPMVFSENKSKLLGGGLLANKTRLVLGNNVIVTGNEAASGGGIFVNESEVELRGAKITGNKVIPCTDTVEDLDQFNGKGGGITHYNGQIIMNGGEIAGNKAENPDTGVGGGVYNLGNFIMRGGRLCENTAGHGGDDFYNEAANGGIFTLPSPTTFGYDKWYEDAPDNRWYDPSLEYECFENCNESHYLTLQRKEFMITLTPMDMTAYSGGTSSDNTPFPTTRYKIEAPEGVDFSSLQLMVNNVLQELPDGTQSGSIVILNMFNETFNLKNEDISDQYENALLTDVQAGDYTISVLDQDQISATIENKPIDIQFNTGVLTVRNISDREENVIANPVISEKDAVNTSNGGIAQIPDGTKYYTNGKAELDVLGVGTPDISLLFDDILSSEIGVDTKELLTEHAKNYGYKMENGHYELKYLDLVNVADGNAWVSTDDGVTITIYWPIPVGVTAKSAHVLHFKGLHREYRGDLENQIEKSEIEKLTARIENGNAVFTLTGNQAGGSFSPFALIWESKDDGGSGTGTTHYTITTDTEIGGEIDPNGNVRVASGSNQTCTITPEKGYKIVDVIVDGKSVGVVNYYTFENIRSNHTIKAVFEKVDSDNTGVSDWFNTRDHNAYLDGYDNGAFGPSNNMTRAEVSQMFYNLLLDKDVPITVNFSDVPDNAWYTTAVNTLASLGLVEGVGNNQFAPERPITRAEFTIIAMRFTNGDVSGENIFSDVSTNDWFYDRVVGSIQYGWITGYEDGTFRPYNTIARAEVTTIVNRMLGRTADEDYANRHEDDLRLFPDVTADYWGYYQIVEATNAHDYSRDNGVERWTKLN